MTDTVLLTSKIKECGSTTTVIAEQLGLSRQGFWKKLNNKAEFKQSEIEKITRILNLDVDTQRLIFFTLNVG